ncbi:hypothetical protein HUB98_09015 [Paenibacillus barcinonensis]|uniref:DUF2577 domain-containing protein n=1 Tax=Paenibacillus barcinonensis TaxID=198119 RepID=A0A2V4WPS8_PAEBA|nr:MULTISPECIES: hypothetical protein [Paenibacillus]PYE49862.1 hypothetical protein DFQ00_105366 [Paenibacillus barcinonensis]QKS56465.1 hypothetical protein HUB98_09015 [Paenibacillus barcinonensis]
MMGEAMKLLKQKVAGHIDARDTERATLLSWPAAKIEVDGDPYPYESGSLVFADYLQEREIEVTFDVAEPEPAILKGKLLIPSPLEVGDRLLVSRMTGQRYYVLGKER